jgi:hypothetical protein
MTSSSKTTLWLPPDILSEIMFYVTSLDSEVGGLGLLEIDKNNNICVEEIYLLEQTVHGAKCELSSTGISNFYEELIAEGRGDDISKINFWWHSHNDMGAFFSTTDDTTMKEWPGQYQVALVINNKGEMKGRLMSRVPALMIMDVDIMVDWLYVTQCDEWKKNIAEKVTKEVIPTYQPRKVGEVVVYQGGEWIKYDSSGTQIGKPTKNNPYTGINDTEAPTPRYKSIHEMSELEIELEMNDIDYQIASYLGSDSQDVIDSAFSTEMDDDEKAALHAMWTEGYIPGESVAL